MSNNLYNDDWIDTFRGWIELEDDPDHRRELEEMLARCIEAHDKMVAEEEKKMFEASELKEQGIIVPSQPKKVKRSKNSLFSRLRRQQLLDASGDDPEYNELFDKHLRGEHVDWEAHGMETPMTVYSKEDAPVHDKRKQQPTKSEGDTESYNGRIWVRSRASSVVWPGPSSSTGYGQPPHGMDSAWKKKVEQDLIDWQNRPFTLTPEESHTSRLAFLKKLEVEIEERRRRDKQRAEEKRAGDILGYTMKSNLNTPFDVNSTRRAATNEEHLDAEVFEPVVVKRTRPDVIASRGWLPDAVQFPKCFLAEPRDYSFRLKTYEEQNLVHEKKKYLDDLAQYHPDFAGSRMVERSSKEECDAEVQRTKKLMAEKQDKLNCLLKKWTTPVEKIVQESS